VTHQSLQARSIPVLLSTAFLLVHGIIPSSAHTFRDKNFDALVMEADQILVGTVASAVGRKLPNGAIVTDIALSGVETMKGPAVSETVLTVLGGTVGEETLELTGLPTFELTARYLIFLKDDGRAIFPVVGGDHGLFHVEKDHASGEDIVLDAYGRPLATSRRAELPQDPSVPNVLVQPGVPLRVLRKAILIRLQLP